MKKLLCVLLLFSMLTACAAVFADEVAWQPPAEDFYTCLATYTTTYATDFGGRVNNIERAAKSLDGIVLQPGQQLSFNQAVGPRTAARGYQQGYVIEQGKYVLGMGGGICQVSTTLFNTALLSNMQIDQRHCHSIQSDYVPAGRDATVAWGSLDFKMTNPHQNPVKLSTYAYNGTLTISIYGAAMDAPHNLYLNVVPTGYKQYLLTRTIPQGINYSTYSSYQ